MSDHKSFFTYSSDDLERNKKQGGRKTIGKFIGPTLSWFDHRKVAKQWLKKLGLKKKEK